jgi:diacylglycerol kinase family enzyme
MKICVIFNPAARGAKAARFRDHLGSLSAQCALKPTYAVGSGRGLAAEAVREGFELIVAAGGDGTLNEVLNRERIRQGVGHAGQSGCGVAGSFAVQGNTH